MTIKRQVISMIEQLPEEATLEDIEYHLYVRQKIEAGRRAVEEGQIVTQEEAKQQVAKWLQR